MGHPLCFLRHRATKPVILSAGDVGHPPVLEFLLHMSIGSFLTAAGKKGVGLMTGGLLSLAIAVYEHWNGKPLATTAFTVVAITAILAGAYYAYAEEHAEKISLARQHLPQIAMRVHSISISPQPGELNTAVILTILSVRNTGAPSIVDTFKLRIDDHPELEAERITLIKDLAWQYPNLTYTYSAQDQIHKKVADQPVTTGGKKVGFMLWRIRGIDIHSLAEKMRLEPKLTVTARDITGNLITATNAATDQDDMGAYYPGLIEGRDPKHKGPAA